MASYKGSFGIAQQNNWLLRGVSSNDFIIFTTNSNQSIAFGCSNNSNVYLNIASNGRIGINNSNPSYTVDIKGDINFTGNISSNGTILSIGSSVEWSNSGFANSIFTTSNVGIGILNPLAQLHVGSNVRIDGDLTLSKQIQFGTIDILPGGTNTIGNIALISSLDGYSNMKYPSSNVIVYTLSNKTSNDSFRILASSTSNEVFRVNGVGDVSLYGSLIPASNQQYDLGSSNFRFRDLYISGNTIDMGGVKISIDSSNNVKFRDSNNALKKIIVDEIQIGEQANGAIRIRKDAVTGSTKFYTVNNSGVETIDSSLSTTITLSNVTQTFGNVNPPNGYLANTVTVPTLDFKTLPSSAITTYGQLVLGGHAGVSLTNNSTMSFNVNHNLGTTDYMVFAMSEFSTGLQINITTKTSTYFTFTVKNVSGSSIVNPVINYQILSGTMTTQSVAIAQAPSFPISTSNIWTYSGANTIQKIFALPSAVDPQGYNVTYSILSDTTTRATLIGSNLAYAHAKANSGGTIVVKASNPYINDNNKKITLTLVETRLNNPLNGMSSTISQTQNTTASGVAGSVTLSNTDQSLPLTWSLGTNSLGANLVGNVISWTSLGSSTTRSAVVTARFEEHIMTEANLTAKTVTLNVNEVYTPPPEINAYTWLEEIGGTGWAGTVSFYYVYHVNHPAGMYVGRKFKMQLSTGEWTNEMTITSINDPRPGNSQQKQVNFTPATYLQPYRNTPLDYMN